MNRKKPLFSNSFSGSLERKHKTNKQKKETIIDLTLSDDSDFELPSSSSSSLSKKVKKRKLNSKKSKSFIYESDDDELSDDIFSSLPITQESELRNSNEQSTKKNVRFAFGNEYDTPKKRKKEYKLSNVQVFKLLILIKKIYFILFYFNK